MGKVITFHATNGSLERLDVQADSLDEATLQLPGGAYTVLPIFPGGQVVRFERHAERMADTLHRLGIEDGLEGEALRRIIRACYAASGLDGARMRVALPASDPRSAYASIEAWQPYGEALYEQGVRAVTVDVQREDPRAKSTAFIKPRAKLLEGLPEGIYEAILLGTDGRFLEGATSNFYAVLDGVVRTAGGGVLRGIARSIVLEACELEPQMRLVREPIHKDDLSAISEAMLSSVSRGVVPIVEIDGEVIGEGKLGPVFNELRHRYRRIFEREVETL